MAPSDTGTACTAVPPPTRRSRLPLSQVNPDQQILDTETKLIHHAIRIAAFNTAQTLARAIVTATGYTRAIDELCHALNDTHTVYPGTDLTLRHSIKPHRRPPTNY